MSALACINCGQRNTQCLLDSEMHSKKTDVYILRCNDCGEEEEKSVPIRSTGVEIAPSVELWEGTNCPFCGKSNKDHKRVSILDSQLLLLEDEEDIMAPLIPEEVQKNQGKCPLCDADLAPFDGGGGVYCPKGCQI